MVNKEQLVLKTLLYFDIFDYPLTKEEIWQFTKFNKKNKSDFFKLLGKHKISSYKEFYFLKGKRELVNLRQRREKISNLKIKKLQNIICKLILVPSVSFIGISGALSMKNCDVTDDMDIFVIAKQNLVWFTRLMLVILLIFMKSYRNKSDKNVRDKVCLNFIIGDNTLAFSKNKQNMYIAHEIAQLVPVFDKNNTYKDFINSNKWIFQFLPNSLERINSYIIRLTKKENLIERLIIEILLFIKIEKIIKYFQIIYMSKDVTKEEIKDNFLAFHPFDYKEKVLSSYGDKLNNIDKFK